MPEENKRENISQETFDTGRQELSFSQRLLDKLNTPQSQAEEEPSIEETPQGEVAEETVEETPTQPEEEVREEETEEEPEETTETTIKTLIEKIVELAKGKKE